MQAVQESSLSRPASTILLGDSIRGSARQATLGCDINTANNCASAILPGPARFPDSRDTEPTAARHLEGHNFAFTDGHVKWYKLEGAPTKDTSLGFDLYYFTSNRIHWSGILQSLSGNVPTFAIRD